MWGGAKRKRERSRGGNGGRGREKGVGWGGAERNEQRGQRGERVKWDRGRAGEERSYGLSASV